MARAVATVAAALALLAGIAAESASAALPPVKHVWIVVLENEDYATTFGSNPPAPYLGQTLPSRGELLTQYYGIGHHSLDNYLAMISGQPPDPSTQGDCPTFSDFVPTAASDENGVETGDGCVYPARALTIGDQLEAKGLDWKGYMEDMGTPCRHPEVGAHDPTLAARPDDQYAVKHDPFVYFHSIIDRPACRANVVDLSALEGDLASASQTPAYSFITPDLCADGHDAKCADGTSPGGYDGINAFLSGWVPKITRSPAYKEGGLLIVTFDEAGNDASACCGEPTGPNTTDPGDGPGKPGGGRTGAVLLSPFVKGGTVNDTPYNHYSLLRSTEDLFGLPHLANAAQEGLKPFEEDVYNKPDPKPKLTVSGIPRGCAPSSFRLKVKVVARRLGSVTVTRDGHRLAKRKVRSFSVRIHTKKLKQGKHRLVVAATDGAARSTRKTGRFRVCT
jgi:phosphatidylinositol-3-phosphatase